MTGAASRRRGADAERAVVNYLRANGFPGARRHHGADGLAPGDIDGVPGVCIEVKDRASSAWPSWRMQLLLETDGDISILVRRTRGVPDVGLWVAEMPFPDWLWIHYQRTAPVVPIQRCKRTGRDWVRTTFGEIFDAIGEPS